MIISRLPLLALCVALVLQSGCAWVHFGRIPPSDKALAMDNADLRVERKILQQELALARKEGESLRVALEVRSRGEGDSALATRLAAASRELSELRESYAKLQSEASGRTPASSAQRQLSETEDQMASRLRELSDLRREADSLRDQVREQKQQNLVLEERVRELNAEGKRSAEALSQLNAEVIAQKEARDAAELAIASLRTQLQAVVARERAVAASSTTFAASPSPAASEAQSPAKPAASFSFASARMGSQDSQPIVRSSESAGSPGAASTAAERSAPRKHVVATGETLEIIARKYYGQSDRWPWIYAANNQLLRDGRQLKPGMELVIPGGSSE